MTLLKDDLSSDPRYIRMKAKRDGKCAECGDFLEEGTTIIWDTQEYKAYCEPCGEEL